MVDEVFHDNFGPFSIAEIIKITKTKIANDGSDHEQMLINSLAPLDTATKGDLSFLHSSKYVEDLTKTHASACIMPKKFQHHAPKGLLVLLSEDPYLAYCKIANEFYPSDLKRKAALLKPQKTTIQNGSHVAKSSEVGSGSQVAASAVIDENAIVGENCIVEAGAYIGKNVVIGDFCVIGANASITNAIIGAYVKIYPNANVGQDGFGFAFEGTRHLKVPQLGRVIIENDVEIGSSSCIDRGSGHDTFIGEGTKIDNLVQIGHNVEIGKFCLIAAQTGIAGSTKVGDFTVIGGQVGISGHLKIGHKVQIAAQSGVIKNVEDGTVIGGYPALPIKKWHRQTAILKQLVEKKDLK